MPEKPTYAELEKTIQTLESENAKLKQIDDALTSRLSYLGNLELVDHVIRNATGVEQMMSDVLQAMLKIFGTDRAWLLYPCAPDEATMNVQMEKTRPKYPGAFVSGEAIPMQSNTLAVCKAALEKDEVLTFDYRTPGSAQKIADKYLVLTEIILAIHPNTGSPWLLGMHQCSHYRNWTAEDKSLFHNIGSRIKDSLGSMMLLRDLKTGEEKYRQLVTSMSDVIIRLSPEGKILFITPAIDSFTGYNPDDEVGKSISNYFADAKELESALELLSTVLKTPRAGRFDFLFQPKTKAPFPVEVTYLPIIEDDNVTEIQLVLRNISERTRAEELLVAERLYSDRIIESMPGLFYIFDKGSARFIRRNTKWADVTGFSEDELDTMTAIDVVADKDLCARQMDDAFVNGTSSMENSLLTKAGNQIPHLFTGERLVIDGKAYLVGMGIDITDQKSAEQTALQKDLLLNEMGRIAKIGGWEHDLISGRATWTIEIYSIMELDTEFPLQVEKHLEKYIPEDRPIIDKQYRNAILTGESFSCELRCISSLKRKFWARVIGRPVFEDGRCVKMRGTFQDITLYKSMELRLQQAQKMEAIGTLAGGIAHDFNNILFPLMGYAELLKDDIPDDSTLQNYIDGILHAASRSRELVKQILAFSRHEHQEKKPMKLQSVVKEALKLLRSSIPTTIKIEKDISASCGVVLADPTQIHQVVMNLATNAYHAMEDTGGTLDISLSQIFLELDEIDEHLFDLSPGEHALLSITDTGCGVEKEILDKIFDPYFTTKETGKGTGLGLSVVLGIINSFDGDIYIESKPGAGTTVKVYLPIITANENEQPEVKKKAHQPGTERVLLVDDEVAIVGIVQHLIERLGYTVTTKTDSPEALEVFKTTPDSFDLIITDMTMPDMTGLQLAEEVFKIKPGFPIIMCTGYSDKINVEKSKAVGIQDIIMKPVDVHKLSETIREVLDKKK